MKQYRTVYHGAGKSAWLWKLLLCLLSAWLTSAGPTVAKAAGLLPIDRVETTIDEPRAFDWIAIEPAAYPLLVINIVIDGTTIPALLDSRSSYTMIDKTTAEDLAMQPRLAGKVASIDGGADLYVADCKSLDIGAIRQTGGSIAVLDLRDLRRATGDVFAAVIGSDVLGRFALQVDWDHDRFRLLPSGKASLGGSTISLEFDETTHQLATSLSVNGLSLGTVAVDTGADGTLTIAKSLVPRLAVSPDKVTDRMVMGISGSVVNDYFRAQEVRFGELRFANMPTNAGEVSDPGFPAADAQIEMEFLSQFNFVMDAPAGHIEVMPRAQPAPPLQKSTSGVQGSYRTGSLVINHVMRNSPAALAGLKDGDQVCAVNGQAVDASWESGQQRAWSVGAPGSEISLSLCSGNAVSFTLADFY